MEDRKRLVLKAIVDYHIKSGEPVSSKTLLEDYGLDVSSATIRNDMKALDEKGLISKAYSSAGRVPTQRGYRFFVDWLIELSELTQGDHHAIIQSFRIQRQDIEQLLKQTAFLLAKLSGYAGVVLSPRLEETRLESILFVRLDPENALVVIVSELGIIEYRVIPSKLSEQELSEIGELLNRELHGRRLGEVRREAIRFAEGEGWYDQLVRNAFGLLRESLERRLERRLHVEGLVTLMEQLLEEGHSLETVRQVAAIAQDPQALVRELDAQASSRVQASIGGENALKELWPCSIVFMGYGFSGALGVIGPVRMDYSRAFSMTAYVGNRLQAILTLSHRDRVTKGEPILKREVS